MSFSSLVSVFHSPSANLNQLFFSVGSSQCVTLIKSNLVSFIVLVKVLHFQLVNIIQSVSGSHLRTIGGDHGLFVSHIAPFGSHLESFGSLF